MEGERNKCTQNYTRTRNGLLFKNHLITIKTAINPHKATKYGLFEHIKSNFCDENPTNMQRFFAGATAGAVSQTIIYPMEVIKTRMVLRATGQYSNSFDLISYGYDFF